MNYEDYDEECEKIKAENETYLALFEEELRKKNLKEKTILRHCQNVKFYINTYLNYWKPQTMDVGCYQLYGFLGDFFIRKCLWSTPESIKSTAASIKKFYKCMLGHGKIEKESYKTLCEIIKDDMEDWQNECAIYNDPNQENPFMPW